MSKLSIGLVTSPSEESVQLIGLLEKLGVVVLHHISPQEIQNSHIEDNSLNVWLLNVDDDHWHDNIDQLLDESDASIYFNEPGTLNKQSHPEYWAQNLVNRLYELTGLTNEPEQPTETKSETDSSTKNEQSIPSLRTQNTKPKELVEVEEPEAPEPDLSSALDQLQNSSIDLPSDIAAELVSELESISPDLETNIENYDRISELEKKPESQIEPQQSIEAEDEIILNDTDIADQNSSLDDEVELDILELDILEDDTLELDTFELDELGADDYVQPQPESEIVEPEMLELNLAFDIDSDILSDDEITKSDSLEKTDSNAVHENAEIGSEILELAGVESVDLSESNTSTPQLDTSLDEIDFSNSSIPMLESARDDDSIVLESNYEISDQQQGSDDDEQQESDQQNSSDTIDSYLLPEKPDEIGLDEIGLDEVSLDGIALETDESEKESPSIENFELGDLQLDSLELDSIDEDENNPVEKIRGKAVFEIGEEPDLDRQSEPEEITESCLLEEGLSLQSIDQPAAIITGKAVFEVEDEMPAKNSEVLEGQEEQAEEEIEISGLDELSLESIGDQPTTGKAIFLTEETDHDEASESKPEEITKPSEPQLPESDLTLESNGEQSSDGKAQFHVDDAPLESVTNTDTLEKVEKPAVEEPVFDFELESMTLEEDVLSEEDQPLENERSYEAEISSDEAVVADQLEISEEIGKAEQIETPEEIELLDEIETPDEKALSEEMTFEIPMLEEAATGVDFEEPVKPSFQQEKTPCWVIGASLGGPAAVKRFLQSLPADINASFIIVQHIDENFLPVLADILTSNSHFEVKVANGSNMMTAGKIYLAPLKGKLIFLQDGSMLVDHSQKWSEPYSPCIDDVIEALGAVYKQRCGAIIFSGMGQDGLRGSRKMHADGGEILAQSTDTCANSSMPEAVINADLTSFVGSPEMLADKLAEKLAR